MFEGSLVREEGLSRVTQSARLLDPPVVGMSYGLTPCPLRPLLSSEAIKHFIITEPGETEALKSGVQWKGGVIVAMRRGGGWM